MWKLKNINRVGINLTLNKMKKVFLAIVVIGCFALLSTSCKKTCTCVDTTGYYSTKVMGKMSKSDCQTQQTTLNTNDFGWICTQ